MSDILNEVVTRFIWDTAGAGEGADKLRDAIKKVIAGHKEAGDAAKSHASELQSLGGVANKVGDLILSKIGGATLGIAALGVTAAAGMLVVAQKLSSGIDETEAHYKSLYDETLKLGKETANIDLAPNTQKAGEDLVKLREHYKSLVDQQQKLLPDYAQPGQNFAQSHGYAGVLTRIAKRAQFKLAGTSLEEEQSKFDVLQKQTLHDIANAKTAINKSTSEQLDLSEAINQGDVKRARDIQLQIDKKKELAELTKFEEDSDTKLPKARQDIEDKYKQRTEKMEREYALSLSVLGVRNQIASVSIEAEDRVAEIAKLQLDLAIKRKEAARGDIELGEADVAVNQALRNQEQINLSRTMGLSAEQARTRELMLQVKGREDLAKYAREEAQYTQEIATLRYTNPGLIPQRMANRVLEREQDFYSEFGDKTDSQISRGMIRRRRTEERRRIRRDRFQVNGGLINVRRDMSGRVIGGINPLTGEEEDHTHNPLAGTAEQGLHAGGVQSAQGLMNGPHSNSMATTGKTGLTAFEQQILDYVKKIADKPGLN